MLLLGVHLIQNVEEEAEKKSEIVRTKGKSEELQISISYIYLLVIWCVK